MDSIKLNDELQDLYYSKFADIGNIVLQKRYDISKHLIDNFQVYDDDVWVCSFPRTGTTWTEEMVWLIGNKVDFKAAETDLTERFPFFESSLFGDANKAPPLEKYFERVQLMKRPRFIKTHLPWSCLPNQIKTGEIKPKITYVTRNPKDVCVSYYHFMKLFKSYTGSFKDFASDFLNDQIGYAPFWGNVLGYWNNRNIRNINFITYEEMKNDLESVIIKTANYLGVNINSDKMIELVQHLQFNSMKNNKAVNFEKRLKWLFEKKQTTSDAGFIRKGDTGSYKLEMDEDLIKEFDEWIDKNINGTDFVAYKT